VCCFYDLFILLCSIYFGKPSIIQSMSRNVSRKAIRCQGKGEGNYQRGRARFTRTKRCDDLEHRIKNLEALFTHLRDQKLKQNVVVKSEVEVKSEDDKSSKDDKCSEDSSEELIKFLSRLNLQWQFLKQSHEEEPKPVPSNTEEEDLLQLDIVYPVEEIASSSRGTCRRGVPHTSGSRGNRGRGEPLASSSRGNKGRGETRYALRSLGHI
ncbi:hypothetical protein Tco_1224286, partial [Tanacetum coccineum]